MSELPCVGAGITVVDPGPSTDVVFRKRKDGRTSSAPRRRRSSRASWHEPRLRLLKAYVTAIEDAVTKNASPHLAIYWRCGTRSGHLSPREEGTTWVHGHGPQARGALLAQRALERQK